MKIYEALAAAIGVLEQSGVSNPRQDAESLLEAVLGKPRTFLVAHSRDSLELPVWDAFHAKVMERTRGKPLQYILGTQEFLGMEFEVTPEVLIPRPETELLVETARQLFASLASPRLADVGTGSGCIAVSLAVLLPSAHVSAVDLSPSALEVARRNASKHRVLSRVAFRQGDLLAPIESEEGRQVWTESFPTLPMFRKGNFPACSVRFETGSREWPC
ncbi:MAG: HemK/PrmC family methyltransferase [Terriglobia bacterium]